MLAYLCVVNNPGDDLRLTRIINAPQGIGATTSGTGSEHRLPGGPLPLGGGAPRPGLSRAPEVRRQAGRLYRHGGGAAQTLRRAELPAFYEELVQRTGYAVMLEAKNTVEDRTRLENVQELLTSINGYLENAGGAQPLRLPG